MVFVGTVTQQTVKGEDVKGIRIRHTSGDFTGYIVIRVENPSSALGGENLQRQVSDLHLSRFLDSFYELFVIGNAPLPASAVPSGSML